MKLWWLDALDADREAGGPAAGPVLRVEADADAAETPAASTFDEARALIAMACADGAPSAAERACVARFVDVAGVDGAVRAWRVWRPREAGVPDGALGARRVLRRMAEVALCDRDDGVVDDSERALLLTYARAYGVADDEVVGLLAELAGQRAGPVARLCASLSAAWPVLRRRSSPSSAAAASSSPFASVVVRPREVR